MATMATNHVTVAMGQVATTSLPRYSQLFSNYIIPSHYDQMLFFSVYLKIFAQQPTTRKYLMKRIRRACAAISRETGENCGRF